MTPEDADAALRKAHKAMGLTSIKEHACALASALASVDEYASTTSRTLSDVVSLSNKLMMHLQVISASIDGIGAALVAGRTVGIADSLRDLQALLAVHREHAPIPSAIPYRPTLDVWPDAFTPSEDRS